MPTVALACLTAPLILAAAPPATAPGAEPAAAPGPDLAPIERGLAEIRGLAFRRDVPARMRTMDEWGEFVGEKLDEAYPPAQRRGLEQGLLRLGMFTEPVDIGTELKGALLSQAAAHYDPETQAFYYIQGDLPAAMLEMVAAHELVHALQDQYFDLDAMMAHFEDALAAPVRDDDAVLAARFLIEGEATYVSTIWQIRAMSGMDMTADKDMEAMQFRMMAQMDIDQLVAMNSEEMQRMLGDDAKGNPLADAVAAMETIPPYILHPLYAAYMKGAYLAMAIRHAGGWLAVNGAFIDPPATTEQALHPDKYTGDTRDRPTPIELPEAAWLGDAGWTPIDAARNGEYLLGLLLRNFGCPGAEADDAVAGWDGDVYRAWRHEDGRVLVALATTWDTEDDATEFFRAYRSILPSRYEHIAVDTDEDDEITWDTGDERLGRGTLVRRGREVFLVDGGPADLVARLAGELRATEVAHVD